MSRSSIVDVLAELGAVLVRNRNHLIYRFPNGQTFVMSRTPSDYRAERNMVRDARAIAARASGAAVTGRVARIVQSTR